MNKAKFIEENIVFTANDKTDEAVADRATIASEDDRRYTPRSCVASRLPSHTIGAKSYHHDTMVADDYYTCILYL